MFILILLGFPSESLYPYFSLFDKLMKLQQPNNIYKALDCLNPFFSFCATIFPFLSILPLPSISPFITHLSPFSTIFSFILLLRPLFLFSIIFFFHHSFLPSFHHSITPSLHPPTGTSYMAESRYGIVVGCVVGVLVCFFVLLLVVVLFIRRFVLPPQPSFFNYLILQFSVYSIN